MKIFINNELLFEINDTQKKVIANDIAIGQLHDEMKRRLRWVIEDKYNKCMARLKLEWEPKLIERGVEMFPADLDAYANLIFDQPDYKDRSARDEL